MSWAAQKYVHTQFKKKHIASNSYFQFDLFEIGFSKSEMWFLNNGVWLNNFFCHGKTQ
jgi:hypothetical protein